ncbi:hypothetical protein NMY22_g4054 [Coprinellus aureogranulatus]|nr:hypothetical protein NMY22_g4054 [Coprinellus aureogranulatus]
MPVEFPNEVLSRIVNEAVYCDEDFRETLARDPLHHVALTSGPSHDRVTMQIALVNRQFHSVAIEELWRYVPVRSPKAIDAVAALAPKYGHHTQRVDFRLRQPYLPHLVGEILKCMPKLKVVMMYSKTDSPLFHHLGPPIFAIAALSHTFPPLTRPLIKRVDFEGRRELPSPIILRDLLNANPQLISLRVADVTLGTHDTDWSGSAPLTGDSRLEELSLGSDYARLLWDHSPHGLDSFVDMLCAQPALNQLKTVHIKQFTPSMYKLLQLYGPTLRRLTMECPNNYSDPLHNRDLINLCPDLESVVWYITDCGAVEPRDCIPAHHPNIRVANILYNNPGSFLPQNYTTRLQEILRLVRDGQFPMLKEVNVKLRGFATRDLPNKEWFHEMQKGYAGAGITLRGS